jgi:hypothetical protein
MNKEVKYTKVFHLDAVSLKAWPLSLFARIVPVYQCILSSCTRIARIA